jgi:hypothetical protein
MSKSNDARTPNKISNDSRPAVGSLFPLLFS